MAQTACCGGVPPVAKAVGAVRNGEAVVVIADERGTQTGGLVFAAQAATPRLVAFTVRHTSGFVCVSLTADRLADLGLAVLTAPTAMASDLRYTVTVDVVGSGTGISARARAATIAALGDPVCGPQRFTRPGHVVPVQPHERGVLGRRGMAEAAAELAACAGHSAAAAFAHLVSAKDPRELAGPREAHRFADRHGLGVVHVDDLVLARGDDEIRLPA